MNTHITESNTEGGASAAVPSHAAGNGGERKSHRATESTSIVPRKRAAKSKRDQLVALLSKPNGARISVIVERLGWQAHTVRAALSGLRKQGIEVAASKSPKTGETVYAIVASPKVDDADGGDRAAS
ncbi:hypothetical protein CSC94_11550 [Zhengella mangrovi]|uniref:DUF3489 domain-containing protein n=1 Tax=Zhengella mangrovi TaxID=1982044 RepID=A0A2G1QMR3_9HYPH|nr:DUF3489 domain-containing protein [Zhengella mangrovi]PHP66740.1 hypothetical protein CSC94_11550 [Zhengella mangrovi]